jgi:osmotically-inducible protein OsmY
MKTDAQLKQDVIDELKWEPGVNHAAIGVAVEDGVVTLSGNAGSYMEKLAAERAAQRVFGVKAVVQEIQVELAGSSGRTDGDIARAAANALEWNTSVPRNRVKVKVQNGFITLTGEVDWGFQKDSAEDAVCCLTGVTGVSNQIVVNPSIEPMEVKPRIEAAFRRHAMLDSRRITVVTSDGKVTLEGVVHSYAEKKEAEAAAYAAPGVREVENCLVVNP